LGLRSKKVTCPKAGYLFVKCCLFVRKMRRFELIPHEEWIQHDDLKGVDRSSIKLPKRSTQFSAGYDIFAPFDLKLDGFHGIVGIPTGIRVRMEPDDVLRIYPRSGLSIKKGVNLANDVGIIDADYNQQIFVFLVKTTAGLESTQSGKVWIKKGQAFAQCVFEKYLLTDDDKVSNTRNGGLGSTG
jgi:dUTP pyrophosphatase